MKVGPILWFSLWFASIHYPGTNPGSNNYINTLTGVFYCSHSIIQVDSSLRRRAGGGRGRGGPIGGGGGGIPPPPPPARDVEEPAMLPSSGGGGDETTTTTTTTTIGNMTPEQASRQFDIHRREATGLERQLEDRVARYQQVRVNARMLFLSPCHTVTSRIHYIQSRARVLVCACVRACVGIA